MSDQTVYAYLICSGAVQKRYKCVAAVMGRVICMYTYGGKGVFEQLCICVGAYRAVVPGKQYAIIHGKPLLNEAADL